MNFITSLIHGSVITSGLFLADKRIFQKDRTPMQYVCFFLFVFLVNFAFGLNADFVPDSRFEIENFRYEQALTPEQRSYYQAKREKFLRDANYCVEQAKQQTVYIPNFVDRDYTKKAIVYLASALISTEKKAILVIATLDTLLEYFDGVIDAWESVNTKLNWAQYYFEMAEFYKDLLAKE